LEALHHELERGTTPVLVIEDVHWADEATLDVLRLLGRRIESVRALVIATYRDDELGREHPLRVVVGALATARRSQTGWSSLPGRLTITSPRSWASWA